MRLLCFQARRFGWKSFAKTLEKIGDEAAPDVAVTDELGECVVVFAHAERADEGNDARARVFRHTVKHIKWLANKRGLRGVVLHSFTHLGAESASPAFAQGLLQELSERLTDAGYTVKSTPFGYLCEWSIDVFGESMAKVYKQI